MDRFDRHIDLFDNIFLCLSPYPSYSDPVSPGVFLDKWIDRYTVR